MNAMLSARRRLARVDLGVAVPAVLLALAGVAFIDSAELAEEALHSIQFRWLGLALLVSIPIMLVPYSKVLRFWPLIYLVTLIGLLLVITIAPSINGARRWLIIAGFQFQPSEAAKVATILSLASLCRQGRRLVRVRDWLPPLVLAAAPAALILIQPDLGSSLLFIPVAMAMVFVAGLPWKTLLLIVVLGGTSAFLAYETLLEDYQKERIWSTYNLERMTRAQRAGPGYQLEQSLLAVGNGGVFGHGHGDGPRIQSGKLPYQHNDFIFAVIAEEHGLFGSTLLLIVYGFLIGGVFRVARSGRDPAGRLLCVGIGTLLACQALVHMAVTLGLAPTKGLPLPFVSAGGSSLLVNFGALALVQNVAINRPRVPITGLAPRD